MRSIMTTKRVFKLMGDMVGVSSIAMARLKVSRFKEMNDPFELLGVSLGDKDLRGAFQRSRDQMDQNRGMLCFTADWKNPLMWGHYADNHRGMALGFDIPEEKLAPITYAKKMFDFKVNPRTGEPDELAVKKLLTTKFYDWRYEKEFRVWVMLDHDTVEGGMYFVDMADDLQLKEVVLGPQSFQKIDNIRKLVARNYDHEVLVTKARIAFTRFEVRENMEATRLDASLGN